MARPPALDDGAFDWPPSPSDLEHIDIVPLGAAATGAVPAERAPRPRRRTRPPRSARRARAGAFTRADGLLLLAAGMLLGSAVPSLDTAPPTRLGQRPPVTAMSLVAPPPGVSRMTAAASTDVSAAAPAPAVVVARPPAPAPPAPSAPPIPVVVDARTRQVLAVVRAYERAWTRMDARAAGVVMPSADVEALTRDFSGLREQRLTLSGCRVSGSHATALASCTATRRYRPRQGDHSTRLERAQWQFRMERTPQRWVIAGLTRH